MNDHESLTITEVSKLLRLTRKTVMSHINAGRLPAFKVGKLWRVLRSDLGKFIEDGRIKK